MASIFKKWYSYLDDVLLEETSSEINPLLQVYLSKGRYQLCTEKAIYSYEDKYENFEFAFRQLKWDRYKIEDVLILGLGLAAIPMMLEKHFNKTLRYTAVELDEEIVYLANKYVLKNLSSKMTVINADAFHYLYQTYDSFDMICMDVFLDNIIPDKFREKSTLEALKRVLSDRGVLLYNVLKTGYETETDKLIEDLSSVFEHVWYDQIENNLIIYAMK